MYDAWLASINLPSRATESSPDANLITRKRCIKPEESSLEAACKRKRLVPESNQPLPTIHERTEPISSFQVDKPRCKRVKRSIQGLQLEKEDAVLVPPLSKLRLSTENEPTQDLVKEAPPLPRAAEEDPHEVNSLKLADQLKNIRHPALSLFNQRMNDPFYQILVSKSENSSKALVLYRDPTSDVGTFFQKDGSSPSKNERAEVGCLSASTIHPFLEDQKNQSTPITTTPLYKDDGFEYAYSEMPDTGDKEEMDCE